MKDKLFALLACLGLAIPSLAQSAVIGLPSSSTTNTATTTMEYVYPSGGNHTFAHNLNSLFYQVTCVNRVGSSYAPASFNSYPLDANDAVVSVPAAGDYICAFNASGVLQLDYSFALTPQPLTYQPTMTGTQSPALTVTQTGISGYAGTANYTVSGLPSGMTGSFSPSSVTGSGSSTLTLSFPASQTPATSSFSVQAADGIHTHSQSPSFTVGTINQGLVDCWGMTDGSGSTLLDTCGTGNNETLAVGSFTWGSNAGLPGTTPTFSATAVAHGTNQTATNFDGTSAFTATTWVNLAGTASTRVVMSSLDTTLQDVGWELLVGASGGNFTLSGLLVNNFGSNNYTQQTTSTTFTGGALHYIAMVYDGTRSTTSLKFYIDGVLASTAASSKTLSASIANTKPLSLGGRTDGTLPINGTMAYTRVYNRALSATDIANYFAAGAR